ncbi:hypothetical protein AB0H18_00655 [Streptomyces sp. NPDC020766]|uniref:hypothetical protein n=1 Tax=Streptomyces sp. NPDC020766 TaxID=3155011 RepID=UPI0033E4DA46
MDSIAQQIWPKKHGGRRHGHVSRSARKRLGSQKSSAQLRAREAQPRNQLRAQLRAIQLTARSA